MLKNLGKTSSILMAEVWLKSLTPMGQKEQAKPEMQAPEKPQTPENDKLQCICKLAQRREGWKKDLDKFAEESAEQLVKKRRNSPCNV